MKYENYYTKELQELTEAPLPLGQDWVEVPVRNAEQFIMCQKHHINVITYHDARHFCKAYIRVKFEDIVNLFD